MTGLSACIAARVADLDAASWDACFAGEAEGHAYYAACEAAAKARPAAIATAAACVSDAQGIVAVAPLFVLTYRLDTSLQGRVRAIAARFGALLPALKVLGVGSPYGERCHVGLAPRLDANGRREACRALVACVDAHARARAIKLVAWKDVIGDHPPELSDVLAENGFTRVGGLPVAVLDLPFASEADYLASLSQATRRDVRRKLAKSKDVEIEMRGCIDGLEAEVEALYESTRARSGLDYGDFEALPPGYFGSVSRALGAQAQFALYRVDGALVGFNLLLVEADRVIDKFLGLRYPAARDHNLYAVSWMHNVRWCIARGVKRLQSGQTAYAAKLRLGSRLVPCAIHFRHGGPLLDRALRALAPRLAFDRNDPDLRALPPDHPYWTAA